MSDFVDPSLLPVRTAAEQFAIAGDESCVADFSLESGLYYIGGKGGPCVMTSADWHQYQVMCARWSRSPVDLHDAPGISMLVVDSEEKAKRIGETRLAPADLRRILHALLVSVLEVRQMVATASGTLSVDDYGDALAGATRRLELMEACVQGLLAAKVAFSEAEGGAA